MRGLSGFSDRARSVALLTGSNVGAQAVMLAAMPIASRLYKPEEFGYAAVYLAGVGLMIVVASGRYEAAIPLAGDDSAGLSLVLVSVVVSWAVAAVVALALWVWGDALTAWTKSVPLRPYLWIAPLAIAGAAAYQSFGSWAVREGAYSRIAQTKLLQNTFGAIVLLAVGALVAGPLGLLLSDLATRVTGTLRLGRPLWKIRGGLRRPELWQDALEVARRHKAYPLFSAPGALLNAASLILPPLILAGWYDAETAGLFSLSQRVMLVPLALLGMSVSQVFMSDAARMLGQDGAGIRRLVAGIVRKMSIFGALFVLAAPALPWMFGVIFGERWHRAGLYAALLTMCSVPQLVATPVSGIVLVAQRQRTQLWLDAARGLAILAALCVPPLLQLPAWVTIAAFSSTMGLFYAVSLVVYWSMADRLAGRG